jgi:hypothetical protein
VRFVGDGERDNEADSGDGEDDLQFSNVSVEEPLSVTVSRY